MTKKIITLLFLITFVFSAANAQRSYKSAGNKVSIAGKTLVVETAVYVNSMPAVIDENQSSSPADCSKTGRIIAPTTLKTANNSGLPNGIEIVRLWIKSGGVWRKNNYNKDETSAPDNSIYSIARGCLGGDLKVDEPVKIVVEIRRKGKSYFIASSQTNLKRVY